MPGTTTYHVSDGNPSPPDPCAATPRPARIGWKLEWRKAAGGNWHRVRRVDGLALCGWPMLAGVDVERRELHEEPPAAERCRGCERWWPSYRWALATLRRKLRT